MGVGPERSGRSRNAMLLYLTNLAAIVFSAGLMLLFTGFRPVELSGRRALRVRLTITLGAVLAVALPLTLHTRSTLADLQLQREVTDSVAEWDETVRIMEADADEVDGTAHVELLLIGEGDARPVWQLAELIAERHGGPVELRVLYQADQVFVVSTR